MADTTPPPNPSGISPEGADKLAEIAKRAEQTGNPDLTEIAHGLSTGSLVPGGSTTTTQSS